jgi:hypothetical protein
MSLSDNDTLVPTVDRAYEVHEQAIRSEYALLVSHYFSPNNNSQIYILKPYTAVSVDANKQNILYF